MIREFVLQLKLGSLAPAYFRDEVRRERARAFPRAARLAAADGLSQGRAPTTVVALTRDGLLRVDALLQRFFLPEHADIRYT